MTAIHYVEISHGVSKQEQITDTTLVLFSLCLAGLASAVPPGLLNSEMCCISAGFCLLFEVGIEASSHSVNTGLDEDHEKVCHSLKSTNMNTPEAC